MNGKVFVRIACAITSRSRTAVAYVLDACTRTAVAYVLDARARTAVTYVHPTVSRIRTELHARSVRTVH